MRMLSWVISVVIGVGLLAGAVLAQENSGYLGNNYSKLLDVKSPSGEKAKRWLAPDMTPGKYDKMLLEKTVLFPEPAGTDQVSTATLKEITAYLDEALRRELGSVIQLVTEPGPKTLRVKPAITAAGAKEQGLKPRELIPVAFLLAAAKKATGNRAKDATIAVEYELRDAQSNELVGAGMREGTGRKLDKPTDRVRLADFKPVIDEWARDARVFFQPKPKQ